jgi:hypothetical protein
MFWRLTLYPHCLALDGCLFYKKQDVKRAGTYYNQSLQPNNCLERINIEVRDNDSRFSAKLIQEFLKRTISTKYLHHPYTHKKMVILKVFMRFWQKTTLLMVNRRIRRGFDAILWKNTMNAYIHRCICLQISFRMLEQRTNRTKQRRNKMEDKIQTQIPYQISGNTSLKCSSLRNLVIPLFGGWTEF